MSDLLRLAEEVRRLRARLDRLEAQEHSHGQYLPVDGSQPGASSQPQRFAYPVVAAWYDYPPTPTPDAEEFNANTATYPVGWTQVAPAALTQTNNPVGFWRLTGSSTVTAWKYRRQLAAAVASGDHSIDIGPLAWQQLAMASNIEYLFGLYRDNTGIDENTFLRLRLQWDAASTTWRARAERKDGATQVNGSWFVLAEAGVLLPNPWWLRLAIRATAGQLRVYVGTLPLAATQAQILSVVASYSWGTPWLQLELVTRPASGNSDILLVGGVNRTVLA